jgi:shikimate dehydrogenase
MHSQALYGVIGDPIKHSLSPLIHQQFAQQFSRQIDYQKYQVKPKELDDFIARFFAQNGVGLNVTLPHKQSIIPLLDHLTERAKLCQSVNTIIRQDDGSLLGDTTDGAGFLLDCERLGFLVKNQNILVVGAGGASVSVISSLLESGAKVTLHNRTQSKVEKLANQLSAIGAINSLNELPTADKSGQSVGKFAGIISCVSEFNLTLIEPLLGLLKKDAFAYDLNYGVRAKPFLQFCESQGVSRSADGWGMLVGQAAFAFQHWFKVLPDIQKVALK